MLTKPDPTQNPYHILDIASNVDAAAIKRAYFIQVREHPPERDPQQFKKIRAAYEKINTPEKRIETDMLLFDDWTGPEISATLPLEPGLSRKDIITAARMETDLGRTKWRDDVREITL